MAHGGWQRAWKEFIRSTHRRESPWPFRNTLWSRPLPTLLNFLLQPVIAGPICAPSIFHASQCRSLGCDPLWCDPLQPCLVALCGRQTTRGTGLSAGRPDHRLYLTRPRAARRAPRSGICGMLANAAAASLRLADAQQTSISSAFISGEVINPKRQLGETPGSSRGLVKAPHLATSPGTESLLRSLLTSGRFQLLSHRHNDAAQLRALGVSKIDPLGVC